MTREGDLLVRLPWDGQHVHEPTVVSSRPLVAAKLFVGKSPAQVIAMVPLLFSICGGAQRAAASAALAAAGAGNIARTADAMGVVLETVQEYFWRLLIDWPQAMGRENLATPVATARHSIAASARDADGALAWGNATRMRELGATLAGIAARSIYGMPPGEWLRIDDLARLDDWARGETTLPAVLIAELLDEAPELARSDVSLMPVAPDALMATVVPAMISEPSFSQAPTWGGSPVETGALARMCTQPLVAAADARYGHAVATRMIARLAELATLLDALVRGAVDEGTPAIQAFTLATGEGFAAVQTARGLLLHRALVEQERVADYQIVAPTEWNFHPRGALVSGLSRLASEDALVLSRHARLAVQALDPCVECRIEIGHA